MYLYLAAGFVAGILVVLVIEFIAIRHWLLSKPVQTPTLQPDRSKPCHPKLLADFCAMEGATDSETCMFLNLIIAFMWREWRDTPQVRNYFIKKMNVEFEEMLLHKASGKLMHQIGIIDFCLGDNLPIIQNATVMKIESRNPTEVADELDIAVDIDYSGGFSLSLNVDLLFGKTAQICIKLKSLKGRLRVQYTRHPCLHWSFAFYEEPQMDLEVESHFEGRNLPQLTSFIYNQIRKSVKTKHTLPRYKVRYKPFFLEGKPQDGRHEVFIHNSLVTVGKLEVEVIDCFGLPKLPKGSHVYCTLSIDSLPWKEDMPLRRSLWPVHEVMITRTLSGSVGVSFKQSYENPNDDDSHEIVICETVSPHSPASQVDLKRGDILLAVNDVDVDSIKQAVRLITNAGNKLVFKLQRPPPVHEQMSTEQDEEAINSFTNKNKDETEATDFDKYTFADEESDSEEFVNIVVQEMQKEIAKVDNDVRDILRKASNAIDTTVLDLNSILENTKTPETPNQTTPQVPYNTPASGRENETPTTKRKRKLFSFRRKKHLEYDEPDMTANQEPKEAENSEQTLKPNLGEESLQTIESKKPDICLTPSSTVDDQALSPEARAEANFKLLESQVESLDLDSFSASECSGISSGGTDGDGWDNISHQNVACYSPDEEKEPTGQCTSIVGGNEDPSWNETFAFDIDKQHKFINICVWGKLEERFGKDVLLGFVSIPLMEMALESLSTTSHYYEQSYSLVTPSNRSGLSRSHLRVFMRGLNTDLCNGSISLAYHHTPTMPDCLLTGEELQEFINGFSSISSQGFTSPRMKEPLNMQKKHDFLGTQFYFPTRCDYCQKKVWTKVAFQCRVCAMICHKKCVGNSNANTYCTKDGVRAKPPNWKSNGVSPSPSTPDFKNEKSLDLKSLIVPNVDDLRPGMRSPGGISPKLLRRRTRQNMTNDSIQHPLQDLKKDKHGNINDSIATAAATAKEAGRELFASLDQLDRKTKIETMVQTLQNEIDNENEKRSDVFERLKVATYSELRTRLQTSARKSEERSQALALLMIQYCAALQECTDHEAPQLCDV